MERGLILKRLLVKYENSRHVSQPNTSNRRVMLRIGKNELPEYVYESAEVRDRFNYAARMLENEDVVNVEWLKDRPIISAIVLNLQQIDRAYQIADRKHPAQAAQEFGALIENALSAVKTPWIQMWRDDTCHALEQTLRLPPFCKQGVAYAREFLSMLAYYDKLDGAVITTRAFSTACFQNSKRFEQDFQDELLRAAMRFHPEMAEISAQEEFGVRERLAVLGIYSHPELYQLSGRCTVITQSGSVDLSPLFPNGIAISSSAVDDIVSFGFQSTRKIIFIENLTNYNEYLRAEITPEELVVYHGGFFSPKKRHLLQKLSESMSSGIEAYFWADIDLGGFQMFARLQKLFPELRPMRMSAEDVDRYAAFGLARDASYLQRMQTALERHEFPVFESSIRMILRHGVTIEQEVFLHLNIPEIKINQNLEARI